MNLRKERTSSQACRSFCLLRLYPTASVTTSTDNFTISLMNPGGHAWQHPLSKALATILIEKKSLLLKSCSTRITLYCKRTRRVRNSRLSFRTIFQDYLLGTFNSEKPFSRSWIDCSTSSALRIHVSLDECNFESVLTSRRSLNQIR
jgi:hypothetical protein